MEVGPTGAQFGSDPTDVGYAARFSGTDIARKQFDVGSEYVVIWAKDSEYAYYDSKVAPKCPGLGARDVLRETIDAAKPHGLPVIAYCVVQGNGYPLREHPEFRMIGADGQPIDRICFNSGYVEHAKAVAAEMLAYGIDGFHMDMLDQGFGPPYGCWCEACKTRFEAQYGKPMPGGATWDDDWDRMLEFRYETGVRFERELREYIRGLAPDVTVDFNYHGSPPFSWEVGQRPVQHAVIGDFVTGETGAWGFSALGVGLTASFLAAATPGRPYQIAMQRGVRMYHDMTTRPLNDLRWEALTLLAHGAQVTMVDKTPYDGVLDPVAYKRIAVLFDEVHAKRAHFGQAPLCEVGLYYSARTRDWYGREKPARYQQGFNGAHKALTYEHIPTGILLDENVDLDTLRRFPVVYLPHAAILSEDEIGLFQTYVEEGGRLLATGITGLLDRLGRPRDTCALAALIGAELVEILPSTDNHVRVAASDASIGLTEGIDMDGPFLVEGPAAAFRPTTATAFGTLMKPHRTVRQQKGLEGTGWPMSADAPVGPAVLVNTVGQGTVVYVPCSPDAATAGEHPVTEARRFVRNLVRFLDQDPLVQIEAPLNVQTVVTREKDILRVHLLGYLAPPGCTPAENRPYALPNLIEDAPQYRARITMNAPIREAHALCAATELTLNDSTIDTFVNDIHEIIVIQCGS